MNCVALAVKSMSNHTSPEGWELMVGLQSAGYVLYGHGIGDDITDVRRILELESPSVVVLQDKREYEGLTAGGVKTFDPRERFTNVEVLKDRSDVFKLTVLKDAQNDLEYHRGSAEEIGCHALITYYHPEIIKRLAPWVREQHLIRTWHSVDKDLVPPFSTKDRQPLALLSGAISQAYPLRTNIRAYIAHRQLDDVVHQLPHPGYHRNGCHTPAYLQTLSGYKVAICTSSIYGYALRKIVEATACGCKVITNLPDDEVMPFIDDNLVRVQDDIKPLELRSLVKALVADYDATQQEYFASCAKIFYDYRLAGLRLAADIEAMREGYNSLRT